MKHYMTLVSDAPEKEISELMVWVDTGNSPYSSPWCIADEREDVLR